MFKKSLLIAASAFAINSVLASGTLELEESMANFQFLTTQAKLSDEAAIAKLKQHTNAATIEALIAAQKNAIPGAIVHTALNNPTKTDDLLTTLKNQTTDNKKAIEDIHQHLINSHDINVMDSDTFHKLTAKFETQTLPDAAKDDKEAKERRERLAKKREDYKVIAEEKEKKAAQIKVLKTDLETLNEDLNKNDKSISENEAELKDLVTKGQKISDELNNALKPINDKISKFNALIKELPDQENDVNNLKASIKANNDLLADAQTQSNNAQDAKNDAQTQITDIEKEIKDTDEILAEEIANLNNMKNDLANLNAIDPIDDAAVKELQDKINAKGAEQTQTVKDLAEFKKELDTQEEIMKNAEDFLISNQPLIDVLSDNDKKYNDKLIAANEILTKNRDESQNLDLEIVKFETDHIKDYTAIKAEIADSLAKAKDLNIALSDKKDLQKDLLKQIEEKKAEISKISK